MDALGDVVRLGPGGEERFRLTGARSEDAFLDGGPTFVAGGSRGVDQVSGTGRFAGTGATGPYEDAPVSGLV